MRRWTFRLERVARIRQIEKDAAHGAWTRARAEEALVERRLQQLRDAARAEALGMGVGTTSTVQDVRTAAFRANLRAQAAQHAVGDLIHASEGTAQAASSLLQATRRVDALSRLEERQHDEWRIQAGREATKLADDLSGTRAAAVAVRRREVTA